MKSEIYPDRIPLPEEQQIKHLNLLRGVLNEYLAIYSKASHSKHFANKMNSIMDSYAQTRDLSQGLDICSEVLKYNTNEITTLRNIHIVISRIVHTTIKSLEYNMDTQLIDKVYDILIKVDSEYHLQYRDCYSRLAHIYKSNKEYGHAIELYTILSDIECDKPVSSVVEASYLLTHCYVEQNKDNLSEYDINSTKDILDDYSSRGGIDYYDVRGTVENLENDRVCGGYHISEITSQPYDSLN